MNEEMVTISLSRLKALEHSEKMLAALHNGGVDNWEWYSDSINTYYPDCWNEED